MEENVSRGKTRVGIVVSDKMQKTVVVRVDRMAQHPLYDKPVIRAKKYMAHDEENVCGKGDKVLIKECRPLSRHKRWTVAEVIEKAPVLLDEQPARGEA